MEYVIKAHNAIWSSNGMFLLFLLSVYALYRMGGNKKFLAVYSAVMALLAYNPIAAAAFVYFVRDRIAYARMSWTIPVFFNIAMVCVELISKRKKAAFAAGIAMTLLVAVLCGEFFKYIFRIPENEYKLTQYSVDIADIILSDAQPGERLGEVDTRPRVTVIEKDKYTLDGSAGNDLYFGIRQYTGMLRMSYVQLLPENATQAGIRAYLPAASDYYVVPDVEPYNTAIPAEGLECLGGSGGYLVFKADHRLTVYVVRHGRTEANDERIMMGSGGDSPLTEKGISDLTAIGKALSNARFCAVYTSEAARAKESAAILLEQNQYGCETVEALPLLADADLGAIEGMLQGDTQETYGGDWMGTASDPFFVSPAGGETAYELYQRTDAVMEELASAWDGTKDSGVLVVGHAALGIWMAEKFNNPDFASPNNALVSVLQYHDGQWEILLFNANVPSLNRVFIDN